MNNHAKALPRYGALLLAIAGMLLAAGDGRGATVVGSVQDVTAKAYSGQYGFVQFTPLSTPQAIGTNTIWDVPCVARVTNGLFSVNLVGGYYWATPGSPNKTVKILVPPNDTNVWQFNDCANLATNLGTFAWTNSPIFLTPTNAAGLAVNLSLPYGDFATNAGFAFSGFLSVSRTMYQSAVVLVTNTSTNVISYTVPAGCHSTGTLNVTNVSVCSFFCNAGRWTNLVALPLW